MNFQDMQGDLPLRAVHPNNLGAMCDRVSVLSHAYSVARITKRYAYVEYSNPDEYGRSHPMTALLPVLPDGFIVLSIYDVKNDNQHGEGWQCFQVLIDCPVLWRSRPGLKDWATQDEWKTKEKGKVS